MLPLTLLNATQASPILVELKNGETFNGHLVNCDAWMNINLKEVICTSADGSKFQRIPEIYIRGNTVKYLRIPDAIVDKVKEEQARQKENYRRDDHRGGQRRDGDRNAGGQRRDDKKGGRGGSNAGRGRGQARGK
ncbi:hypothetical protein HDV03_000946 [Kappamyces sp. JEL0829]|nr:hypothetical protein HDV03_000946 [Kappamyces sp. JEL0829]KAJ3337453.1 hypothetical protein HDU91_001487 [Kappamyces sp. JEL0680]